MQRFLRRAAVVVAAAAAAVGTSAVPAVANPRHPGLILEQATGWCTYLNWQGRFYCGSHAIWLKPDGWDQVFVVGPDKNVYTKWASDSGVSGWLNMGGICKPNPGIVVHFWLSDWGLTVNCKGSDNRWYHRERYDDGHWDPQWLRGETYPSA
ncbi:hypothetical protein Ait01nite_097860 [Actinoplanes italicus]|uniref:Peptidase inhibitor family I36 n=1 Tax=Actinoplanes italicus TaxID=113567 RepID=A0A2T0K3D4_9ACTN|nr:hypothetical protein [Actinoplanes italicus]PRX17366.1 hypothetical protein CLV67_116142 [Actinoplanes italicus]GIE36741.1 hypothetical protein Ait01nite_097860 [Actinoplanes italicus]